MGLLTKKKKAWEPLSLCLDPEICQVQCKRPSAPADGFTVAPWWIHFMTHCQILWMLNDSYNLKLKGFPPSSAGHPLLSHGHDSYSWSHTSDSHSSDVQTSVTSLANASVVLQDVSASTAKINRNFGYMVSKRTLTWY